MKCRELLVVLCMLGAPLSARPAAKILVAHQANGNFSINGIDVTFTAITATGPATLALLDRNS